MGIFATESNWSRRATTLFKMQEQLAGKPCVAQKRKPAESELAQLAREEVARLEVAEKSSHNKSSSASCPRPDPTDSRATRSLKSARARGGSESALFARRFVSDVFTRYAEARRWKIEPLDSNPSDLGGFKEIIFQINGTDVFKRLKYARAVFIASSACPRPRRKGAHPHQHGDCRCRCLPEAEEVDVEIKPERN